MYIHIHKYTHTLDASTHTHMIRIRRSSVHETYFLLLFNIDSFVLNRYHVIIKEL